MHENSKHTFENETGWILSFQMVLGSCEMINGRLTKLEQTFMSG